MKAVITLLVMITAAIVLNTTRKLLNDVYTVSLRLTYDRKSKYIAISDLVSYSTHNFKCLMADWRPPTREDNGLGLFLRTVPNHKELNKTLTEQLLNARTLLKEYEDDGIEYNFDQFKQDILKGDKRNKLKRTESHTLATYYATIMNSLEENNQIGLTAIYNSTLSSINALRAGVLIPDINIKFLEAFEAWLRTQSATRILRSALK